MADSRFANARPHYKRYDPSLTDGEFKCALFRRLETEHAELEERYIDLMMAFEGLKLVLGFLDRVTLQHDGEWYGAFLFLLRSWASTYASRVSKAAGSGAMAAGDGAMTSGSGAGTTAARSPGLG
jgi:hypothetical protein